VIPFGLTFVWNLKRKNKKGPNEIEQLHDLQTFLTNRKLSTYFLDFCKKEFSLENPLFLSEVKKFKKIKNDDKRKARAKDIYDTFIASGSLLELNIDSKKRANIDARLADAPVDLFDQVLQHVEVVMNDTFSRFEMSSTFKTLEKKMEDRQDFYKEVGLVEVPKTPSSPISSVDQQQQQ